MGGLPLTRHRNRGAGAVRGICGQALGRHGPPPLAVRQAPVAIVVHGHHHIGDVQRGRVQCQFQNDVLLHRHQNRILQNRGFQREPVIALNRQIIGKGLYFGCQALGRGRDTSQQQQGSKGKGRGLRGAHGMSPGLGDITFHFRN